jgi:hypothetical protein
MPSRSATPASTNGDQYWKPLAPVLREYQMNRTENTRATTAMAVSRANRWPCMVLRSVIRHLICASAENPYGMAEVMPVISTSVVKT